MVALRYGTVPVVRSVGGMVDTVFDRDYSPRPHAERNGYAFQHTDNPAVESALKRALRLWFDHPARFRRLMRSSMESDNSWSHPRPGVPERVPANPGLLTRVGAERSTEHAVSFPAGPRWPHEEAAGALRPAAPCQPQQRHPAVGARASRRELDLRRVSFGVACPVETGGGVTRETLPAPRTVTCTERRLRFCAASAPGPGAPRVRASRAHGDPSPRR